MTDQTIPSRALHRDFPSSIIARNPNPGLVVRVLRWLWLQM
jgi:hypothetical protein